jgi:hypothetical protein
VGCTTLPLGHFFSYRYHNQFRHATLQAGPQPVWDWGQAETKAKYLALVDRALESGISSFFLDKASTFTKNNGTQLCNHVCANLSEAVGVAWDAGHLDVLQTIQAKSPGPTVGNTGFGTCVKMGGCCQEKVVAADENGIQELAAALAAPGVKAIFVHFPMSTAGYAAFLMAHQQDKSWLWWYNGKPSYSGWIPEFNHTLGVPVGDAQVSGGIYTRTFSTGTVVTFNTKTNTGVFDWPGQPPSPPPPPPSPPPSPPTPTPPDPLPARCGNVLVNTNLKGASIGTWPNVTTAAACCARCTGGIGSGQVCTAWAWHRDANHCHLASGKVSAQASPGCDTGIIVHRT